MSTLTMARDEATATSSRLAVVLCGSFHRNPDGLRAAFEELSRCFDVLSPRSVDFIDPRAGFVRLPGEEDELSGDIEARHLEAMRRADLVWLHAPEGYVGHSAAMELGYARALGIPVYSTDLPADEVLCDVVTPVSGIDAAAGSVLRDAGHPGTGLARLQSYYQLAAERRGWAGESARDTLLLLTEELGELARAVRKHEGLSRHQADEVADVGLELADVQLYLVHLANVLGLDLSRAVTAKERVNAERFSASRVA